VSLSTLTVNLKVRTKIVIGFGFVLLILAVVGGMAARSLDRITQGDAIVVQRVHESQIAGEIVSRFAATRRLSGAFSRTGDPAEAAKAEAALRATREAVARGVATITSPEHQAGMKVVDQAVARYARQFDQLKKLVTETRTLQQVARRKAAAIKPWNSKQ
jgi:Four helix bundle sensory module for signal transduction